MLGKNSSAQSAWKHVPRAWGTGAQQVTPSPTGASGSVNSIDRWLAEASVSSPYNNIGQVQKLSHGTPSATSPAPSTNHGTSGSARG
ncbi:hypothetical protein GGTG_09245 [Gaeumannomyces tritici R3-111a-1]|uniref:Uncharacterized protein n=1 Tax=Gaeumannomyces tritici (strain R3-111a-1) TaxID=644352 RepID=J3P6V3_GAET3|nr:hypothetical protein GGTG_09245 [Gaeumannomyces tritici R3-111a-1]EJT72379.1 hypothetical protein GGTG_09245 [Gaeumannomyces tritici R3-111a-1]